MHHPLSILAVLALGVLLCERLSQLPAFRPLGTALLVIVFTAVAANLGVIPTYSEGVPLYDGIFTYVAPIGVFWLLLRVNLRDVLRAGRPMLVMFLIGSAGTVLGVVAALWIVDGEHRIGERFAALGGMFVGTYTGGSINFNAVALAKGVNNDGPLYAGATAVDSFMTTIWMVATLVIPKLLKRAPRVDTPGAGGEHADGERVEPADLALLLMIGTAALWLSTSLPELFEGQWMIVLTTLALVLAQIGAINRLAGSRLLGLTAIYLFLAVIGALCDVRAFVGLGGLGLTLLAFVVLTVTIHGAVTFGAGHLLRADPDVAAVASQANIGGGTSALALARGLNRPDLVLPAILVGSLGNALGTYLGLLLAGLL